MDGNAKTIVWFRRDLRIEDNPALAAASRDGSVFPVFIWCPEEEGQYYPGRVSRWWMKQSLVQLGETLRSLGAELALIKAQSTFSALLECINAVGATKVVYNHLYDPVSLVRDHDIKQRLGESGITVQSFNGDLLYEPWEVYDDKGQAFTTFDAFWNKCCHMKTDQALHLPPCTLVPAEGLVSKCSIEELGLEDESEKSSNALLSRGWSPGWNNADNALTEFVEHHLLDYPQDRLRVAGNSTSLLSPYIHFGEISVKKIFHSVHRKRILWAKEGIIDGEERTTLFLRAIGLREYSRYMCFNFPFTHEKSLLSNLRFFPWHADQAHFKAWRQGRTGYPLVDAGMRELWATGWIHNRIRVIVSSFFVKFLLLPWQWGMKYFWDTLLDADLESDILGWQYISGSLPDGHELERIDSPQVQGFKFDPEGEYVRQWIPELARVPSDWIHHPWDAPLGVLKAAGVELGINYPKPLIDIDLARDRLTEAIIKMRGDQATTRANNAIDNDEEVFDNCQTIDCEANPKVVLRETVPCSATSSRDQKVPSMQLTVKGMPGNKKRPKPEEKEISSNNKWCDRDKYVKNAKVEDDLCSTAISSSPFSVPTASSSKTGNLQEQDYSDLKYQLEDEVEKAEPALDDGAMEA